MQHIVQFEEYCPKCKHFTKLETEDPCWTCLTNPVNEDSVRPTEFKERKEKGKKKN